ncbi:hypothetical protein BDY24DRAFT_1414 [Mrakia frigida]|uniref:WSC domain-containing protein n=1 Tax=Mrakia frigida TaxID=29902 RepID=UPI003FCBFE0F
MFMLVLRMENSELFFSLSRISHRLTSTLYRCYCGNEIVTSSGQGGIRTAASCGSPCPGNADEKCGGNGYNMNLWYDSSRVAPPITPFLAASALTLNSTSPSSTSISSAVASVSNLANAKALSPSSSSVISSIKSTMISSSSSSMKVSSAVATPSSSILPSSIVVVAPIKSSSTSSKSSSVSSIRSSSSTQVSSVVSSVKSILSSSSPSSTKASSVVTKPSSTSSTSIRTSSVVASIKSSPSSSSSPASLTRSSSAAISLKSTVISSASSSKPSSSVVASPSSSKVSSVVTPSILSVKASSSTTKSTVASLKSSAATSLKSSSSSSSTRSSSAVASSKSSSPSVVSSTKLSSTKASSSSTSILSSRSSSVASSVKSSAKSSIISSSKASSSSTSSFRSTTVITSIIPRSTAEVSPAAYANGYDGPVCAKDGATRVIQEYDFSSSAMTVNLCTSTCKAKYYAYAALEYSTQCRCGNTLITPAGGLTTVDVLKCSSNCAGDSTSKCGGFYLMSLYSSPGLLASVSASSVSVAASPTSSTVPSPVSSTSLAYTNGYISNGCMADVYDYVLQGYAFESPSMSISLCTSTCKAKSYTFAALEYSNQCRCGSSMIISGGGGAMLDSSKCEMPCSGDPSSKCGGFYAMSLYSSSEVLQASISSAAASTATASAAAASSTGWTSGICVTDDSARLLTGASMENAAMTPQMCQEFCSEYTYSGTEYSTQCYCGNEDNVTATHGHSPASCTSKCGGDSSQLCGGSYAMTLYTKLTGSWSSTTCVTDGATRLLSAYSFESAEMTNELCHSTCSNLGYIYAATEFGTQGYCGDFLVTSSIVGLPSSGCSTRCAGDSSQFCGGIYQASLSVFS